MSKTALTAEEWARLQIEIVDGHVVRVLIPGIGWGPPEVVMQKIGAACLHEQPFGFTREDMDNHRIQASAYRRQAESEGDGFLSTKPAYEVLAEWNDSMADRIEALLPDA